MSNYDVSHELQPGKKYNLQNQFRTTKRARIETAGGTKIEFDMLPGAMCCITASNPPEGNMVVVLEDAAPDYSGPSLSRASSDKTDGSQ